MAVGTTPKRYNQSKEEIQEAILPQKAGRRLIQKIPKPESNVSGQCRSEAKSRPTGN